MLIWRWLARAAAYPPVPIPTEPPPPPAEPGPPSITCPRCHRTSHHPLDIQYGWCGHCHDVTRPRH